MTLTARDIMTPHVKSVPQTWTMQKFAKFLADNGLTGSPVVDERGEVAGIATLSDIADFHLNNSEGGYEQRMTAEEVQEARRLRQFIFEEMARQPVEVGDIMTPNLFSVAADTPVNEIAEQMMDEHLHRIFVKEEGKVVGIITAFDMLKLIKEKLVE